MKKMYKKPVTEKVALKAEIRCDESSMLVGSCGNPVEGKMGAPRRQV